MLISPPSNWRPKVLGVCAFALSFYCAFILPFSFPRNEPVYGAAYTAGDNILVAAVGVALVSAVSGLIWILSGKTHDVDSPFDGSALSKNYLWWGAGGVTLLTGILGSLIVRQGDYYADAGYFMVRLRDGLLFHHTIYQQFKFNYGLLLYLWPVTFVRMLQPFGLSMDGAYMVSVAAMEAVGVGLIFYAVNALPMRRQLKAIAFCLLTFACFDTLLGINYAIVRCILPIAAIILLARQRSIARGIFVSCLGEILQLYVSPELGVAFGGAAIVYGLYCAWHSGWRSLSISAAALTGAILFFFFAPSGYIDTVRECSNGGLNYVLEPLPYVLVLLVAVTVLAPYTLSRVSLRLDERPWAGMLLGIFVVMLGMLPSAFYQCDALHACVNGVAAYLLSFVAINKLNHRWQRIWIVLVAITFAGTQLQEIHAFHGTIQKAFVDAPPDPYDDPAILPGVIKAVGQEHVTLPFNYSLRLIDGFWKAGIYNAGYYNAHFDSSNTQSEQRRVADMRSAEFALVPMGQALIKQDEIDNRPLKRIMLFGYTYKARRKPLFHGELLVQELNQNWKPVGVYGFYQLYRKVR